MNNQVAALTLKYRTQARMGAILQEQGKLKSGDVDRVLSCQQQSGMRFGETACKLGLVTTADVCQALARQFDYHYVPRNQGRYVPEMYATYDPFSAQTEMLRAVRTHLLRHWFTGGRVALPVMSSDPGEGASTFTANLAVTFSQVGKRTLVIDANLRRPRQHVLFGLAGGPGLADVLARRAGMEVFAKAAGFPLLSILPAGTVPPNPLELLCRPGFVELQRTLATSFDVMLIDVPAFSSGSDAVVVAALTGGAMLVCRRNHARTASVRAATDGLQQAGIEVASCVLIDA